MKENFSLKNYNTFGVEASAKYFVEVSSLNELKQAIGFANQNNLPILFLGGGSNILLTQDFDGLAIQLNLKGKTEQIIDEQYVWVTAQAGENWHEFVLYCINKGYGGLENLSLIPGNVGTSPMQNIGAYGVEIKDVFQSCKALNLDTMCIEEFDLSSCHFGYRESIFKKEAKGKYVIVEVTFQLTRKNHVLHTEYGAIADELAKMEIKEPNIKDISAAVISIRSSKLPNPKDIGNAGSFFKNPTIPASQYSQLKENFGDMPGYDVGDRVKVPAGWLIENAGWKGKQIGNVATHELQALVIINKTGEASGKEIYDYSEMIIKEVQSKYGITLEREVNIL